MYSMYLFSTFFVFFLFNAYCTEINLSLCDKMKDGENRYGELIGKISPYGDCWKKAVHDLHLGCKHLSEEVQSRLALSFTNCFLKHSLSIDCPCPNETAISNCLQNCSERVFSTYTEFFTHTQSICHYLQHREWQEQTEKTVILLTENANVVSKKLDQSSKSQSKIIDLQQVSLLEQRRLITNGRTLNAELQKSRSHARNVFEDFKATTNEQRHLIFEVFDRIKTLQGFVLGEFTSIFTFAYFIVGIIVIYILTSVPRTANARIWLFIIIFINAFVERALASYSIDEELMKLLPLDVNGPMFARIWICRKIASGIAFIVLLYFYYIYEDYNVINNKLLKEIQQQNLDLQTFLQNMKLGEFTSTPISATRTKSSAAPNKINFVQKLMISNPAESSSELIFDDVHKFDGKNEKAKVPLKKTTKKKSEVNKQNDISKQNILQENTSFLENYSGQKRYNLRSRVNSPLQTPYSLQSSNFIHQQLMDAITFHFENKQI